MWTAFFAEFHSHCEFEEPLYDFFFIALIPKNNNATNIWNFWPISLVGLLYKLLAKVLAHRMKEVPDKLTYKS